jgi:predicted CXXCH cytochrome family protein
MRGKDLKSIHRPVASEKCLDCHTPHLSEKAGLPVEKPPQCKDCHVETFERLEKERYVHGPLNLGDCRLCHTIHSSEEPALLTMSPTVLCTQCHSEIAVRPDTPEELLPHQMIPEGECGRCHFPHSSENPMMMREPSSRICYACHPKKTSSFHEKKGFSIYVCQKCHNLHRPTLPHLIVDNSRSLCLQCHEFRTDAAFTHEFILEGGCFICHTFHEAPLSEDIATICLRCHGDNPRLPEAHGGIAIEESRCTNCHRPHQSDRRNLLFVEEHTPFADRECDSCHEDLAEFLGGPSRELCLNCHDDKDMVSLEEEGMTVHPPAEEEDCSYCHVVHASAEKSNLKTRELDLCLTCHRKLKKVTIMKPKSSHEAVLKGECHRCHEPHASPNKAFLRSPVVDLCSSCHDEIRNGPGGAGWASPHPPVDEGKCRLCHRAHTSRKPSLLRAEMPKGCRPCHQEFFGRLEAARKEKIHKPVREGSCASCHGVHGSDGRALLATGEEASLCSFCHQSPGGGHHLYSQAQLEEKVGTLPEAAGLCRLCHLPHVSMERRLLRSSSEEICQACHEM